MKKIISIYIALALTGMLLCTSCVNDLDQYPKIEPTSQSVYSKASNYKLVLAKLYAAFVIAGQEEGGGDPDITGSATGFDYMRVYVNMQEVPSDEIAYTWVEGDKLYDLSYLQWDANDNWVSDMYYHIYYNIALCNEFLRNATDEAIAKFTEAEQTEIRGYRNEARFLRALAYYHAIDLYGNVPFVTENDPVGSYVPPRYTREQLFDYLVSELSTIAPEMAAPSACEYGHASSAAAWALLAKLYLNGEVYTGKPYYTECITACNHVFEGGFSLEDDYAKLFNADNHLRTNEIIFSFAVDATHTVSWGATTYLVCGSVSDADNAPDASTFGVTTGWGSFRAKSKLPALFTDLTGATDQRACFFTEGQTSEVTDLADKSKGYILTKWTNLTDAGEAASNTSSDGVCTDLPIFRLADVYLMYAEAVLRGGTGGTVAEAREYVNKVRRRAYRGSTVGEIPNEQFNLGFILDERGRELYLECTRRTDLIRFGKFTGSDYVWEFKGGKQAGTGVDAKYKLFPIPSTELTANPNIKQNPGF